MTTFNDWFPLIAGIVGGGVIAALFGIFSSRMEQRKTRYDESRHRVELEEMRSYIERQLYETSSKLTANEDRWRDVNHLVLSSQNRASDSAPAGSVDSERFLRSAGVTSQPKIDPKLVFVLTPFNEQFDEVYGVIRATCEAVSMRAIRGDEEFVRGELFPHIVGRIVEARLVIAVIDGRNPNVFYELGVAQALGKPVIVVSGTPEDAPFDLRTKRLVTYKSPVELRDHLRDALTRALVSEGAV